MSIDVKSQNCKASVENIGEHFNNWIFSYSLFNKKPWFQQNELIQEFTAFHSQMKSSKICGSVATYRCYE